MENLRARPNRVTISRVSRPSSYRAGAWIALLVLAPGVAPADVAAQGVGDTAAARPVSPPPPHWVTGTRVLASAREVRVIFPRDTAHAWGWSAREDRDYIPSYDWGIMVNGIEGPRRIDLFASRTDGHARTFPSLTSLVASGKVSLCTPGMLPVCTDSGVTAFVERGRVILSLHDSATVATLFGLRPSWVELFHHVPGEDSGIGTDSVRVEYVAPNIPEPDSAVRARAARILRELVESSNRITRHIEGNVHDWGNGPIWLAVGDSSPLWIIETRCQGDACSATNYSTDDTGWTVDDTTIVQLHPAAGDSSKFSVSFLLPLHPIATPKRAGRTTVHVTVAPSPTDTMPSRTPIPRVLERDIVVTPPIARVEISPRPDTVRVGEQVDVRVRVVDQAGQVVDGAPARLRVTGGEYDLVRDAAERVPLVFDSPGRRTIVASFGGHADTVVVDVTKAPDSR